MEEETVTISKKEYDKMVDELFFLDCLRSAGIDNWEGYDMACDMYRGEE